MRGSKASMLASSMPRVLCALSSPVCACVRVYMCVCAVCMSACVCLCVCVSACAMEARSEKALLKRRV